MALSLSARVSKKWDISLLNSDTAMIVAYRVVEDLGWQLSFLDDSVLVAHAKWSLRSAGEEIRISVLKNDIKISSECIGIQPFGFGKNHSNIKKFKKRFNELSFVLNAELLEINRNSMNFEMKRLNENPQNVLQPKEDISDFFSIFFSGKEFYFTSKIIAINFFLFLLMWMIGAYDPANIMNSLKEFGGVHRGLINEGEWWRLLTAIFVHGNFTHLFFNMYAFLYASLLLEPFLGRFRYLVVYLILGLIASLSSVYHNLNVISVGASGAIFGLLGLILALSISKLIHSRIRISLIISITIFSAYNFIPSQGSIVDNAAHVGGFLGGIFIGVMISLYHYFKTKLKKMIPLVLGISCIVGYFMFVNQYITKYPSIISSHSSDALLVVYHEPESYGSNFDADDKYFRQEMEKVIINLRKSSKAKDFNIQKTNDLIERFEAGIALNQKNLKIIKTLNRLTLTYQAREILKSSAMLCDSYLMLYRAYIHALKNPEKNYSKFINPLEQGLLFSTNNLNDNLIDPYRSLQSNWFY